MKGQPLFDKIKVKLQALQSAEAAAEAAEVAGEVDPNEDLPEDTLDDVSVDDSEEEGEEDEVVEGESATAAELNEEQAKKKTEMVAQMAKMEAKISEIKNQLKM